MFDNLGTALVQALGFFAVFGFFVYQTLFVENKPDNSQKNKVKAKAPKIKAHEVLNGFMSFIFIMEK